MLGADETGFSGDRQEAVSLQEGSADDLGDYMFGYVFGFGTNLLAFYFTSVDKAVHELVDSTHRNLELPRYSMLRSSTSC